MKINIKNVLKVLSDAVNACNDLYVHSITKINEIWSTNRDHRYIINCVGDNLSTFNIPANIISNGDTIECHVDKHDLSSRYVDNELNLNFLDERKELLWKKSLARKVKKVLYTLDTFLLDRYASKYFKYESSQQLLLKDLVNWLNDGGDMFEDNGINFCGLNGTQVQLFELYKNDPIHVGRTNENSDFEHAIEVLTEKYGQIPSNFLYRGTSEAENISIMKSISHNKHNKFKRTNITSFTSNLSHAKKFAIYGGGSSVDIGYSRNPGSVITLKSTKPLFYLDEFLFYLCIAYNISGVDLISLKEAVDNTLKEEEWLISTNLEWKLKDKEKLIFEI